METANKILEDNLNNIGFSFSEQLKPDNIKLSEAKKVKKAIIKAMKEYAKQINHCTCTEDETIGSTTVWCCNVCGLPLKSENWQSVEEMENN